MLLGGTVAPSATYIEDVFSAWTDIGTGAARSIVNGMDFANRGGLMWGKDRTGGTNSLIDTIQGGSKYWSSETTDSLQTYAANITAFNNNGFTLGSSVTINGNGDATVYWSFLQASKFFKMAQVVVSGSDQTVDLSSLGTLGMVVVANMTVQPKNRYVLHRSNTAGKL